MLLFHFTLFSLFPNNLLYYFFLFRLIDQPQHQMPLHPHSLTLMLHITHFITNSMHQLPLIRVQRGRELKRRDFRVFSGLVDKREYLFSEQLFACFVGSGLFSV